MSLISELNRRKFLAISATYGVAHTLFPGALMGMAQTQAAGAPEKSEAPRITRAMIDDAATVAGVHISDEYKDMMLDNLNDALKDYDAIHALHIENSVSPALVFQPILPGTKIKAPVGPTRLSQIAAVETPKNIEDVAFFTVRQLGELLRTKRVSSVALTEMYRHPHHRPRHGAGTRSRQSHRRRKVQGPASRTTLGSEGPARRQRL
jgi:hypothetical protein